VHAVLREGGEDPFRIERSDVRCQLRHGARDAGTRSRS
jgi:hypothetical protein